MSADGPPGQDLADGTPSNGTQGTGTSSQDIVTSSQGNVNPSQGNDTPSQKLPKIWALEDGTMTVVGQGKKRPRDPCMTLQLEFKFKNERKTRIVG